MKTRSILRLTIITGISIWSLAACNNGDYKSSDDKSANDQSAITDSTGTAAADKSVSNTGTAAAIPSGSSTAKATTNAKRKGRVSVSMTNANGEKMIKDKNGVYNTAEVMPQFPGGQNALDNYVNNNIQYPDQALNDDVSGIVRITFVVDENGHVTNAHLINNGQKVGNGLDEEALRVVSNMPTWKPGKVNGKSVKTRLDLPISFQIES